MGVTHLKIHLYIYTLLYNLSPPPQHMCEVRSATAQLSLSPEVSRLVDNIWSEALDQLEAVLAVSVETVTQEQLDKAEAALLSIKRDLDGEKSSEKRERERELF